MRPQEVIRHKRDRQELTADEIRGFIAGAVDGSVSEGQVGAFLMATWLNGMTVAETTALTLAMRDSGVVIDWTPTGIPHRRIIDKHSSGGVGDEKITLIVTPLGAACGVTVPNISARGLDYGPGEVDMLDAVPGYVTGPDPDTFRRVVAETGGAIIGPTPRIAPADRSLFYVRDVTATVESVALITGSIMSKKLAINPSGVVICVGSGSGAFMSTIEQARALATSMTGVAAGAGIDSVMLITDLDPVLGTSVGNAVGVAEAVDFLTGKARDPRVLELVIEVVAEMVVMAGLAPDLPAARALAHARLEDGSAAERFRRIVAGLGGPAGLVDDPWAHLPHAAVVREVTVPGRGYLAGMDAKEIGLTLVALGGGRRTPDEEIDFAVGITAFARVGDAVGPDRTLCVVHARNEAEWTAAADRIRAAIRVSATPPPPLRPIVRERIEQHPGR